MDINKKIIYIACAIFSTIFLIVGIYHVFMIEFHLYIEIYPNDWFLHIQPWEMQNVMYRIFAHPYFYISIGFLCGILMVKINDWFDSIGLSGNIKVGILIIGILLYLGFQKS